MLEALGKGTGPMEVLVSAVRIACFEAKPWIGTYICLHCALLFTVFVRNPNEHRSAPSPAFPLETLAEQMIYADAQTKAR